jgi:hypothetical protein
LPTTYEVVVTFSDSLAKKMEPLIYMIDFGHIYETEYVRERGVADVARVLDKISESVRGWSSGSRPLHAWVQDEDAKDLRERTVYDLPRRRQRREAGPGISGQGQPSVQSSSAIGSTATRRPAARSLRNASSTSGPPRDSSM